MRPIGGLFLVFEGALALSTGYLLVLLVAARSLTHHRSEPPASTPADRLRLVVLVPAHDEQDGIGATLDSLFRCQYPNEKLRIVVIADNCTDRTADRARNAGVEVWERTDPAKRGKGYALAWALGLLWTETDTFEGIVMLDADCLVSANMLSAIERRLRDGTSAVQVNYMAANPAASQTTTLRFAAFALMNNVRFLGKQRLGLSCGLIGSGMGFTSDLLTREPWNATGLVEDAEYHMRIVQTGERVSYVPEAWVSSAVPTSLKSSSSQHARWEQGRLQLIRHWSPRLIISGLAKRDIVRVHTGIEPLVPPQSLITAGSLMSGFVGLLLGSRRLTVLAATTLTAQLAFVLGGLRLVGAPRQVYRALLAVPGLILNKVVLYVRLFAGGGPKSWVRTERENSVDQLAISGEQDGMNDNTRAARTSVGT